MGRHLLLSAAAAGLLLLGGCAAPPAPERTAEAGEAGADPHAELTCASCHRADGADRELGSVPRGACAASGCHTDAGPAEIELATVTFTHRSHGEGEPVDMACAGCHFHESGDEPLAAGTESCGLCHTERLDGDEPTDCRYCHALPDHVALTSQGVEIPHEGLPWIEGECVRCHYDVDAPVQEVQPATCASCHVEIETLVAQSIGEDLHPDHASVSCASCHGEGGHRIVAMSSSVSLECSQCHVRSHELDVTEGFPGSQTCADCHRDSHQAPQRLVLGVLPRGHEATPSEKFLQGLTCRSCHLPPEETPAEGDVALVGREISCAGCHQPEYATVLAWWNRGSEQRLRLVGDYLSRAESLLGAADPEAPAGSPAALLAHAREDVELLEAGGGQHNLPFTHDLFTEVLTLTGDAYAAAGRSAPTPPDLGTRPSQGLCSYCHYAVDDQMRFQEMDPVFHREVLGVEESRRGR